MNHITMLPFWAQGATQRFLRWAEEPDPDDDGDDSDDSGDEGGEKPAPKYSEDDVAGLKKALAAERARAKKLDRAQRLTEQQKADKAAAEKGEVEALTAKLTRAEETNKRLAVAYKESALTSAIEREARKLNFIDIEDALLQVNRSEIEVDQDDDDPAAVEVNAESVKKAVKALADRKKHLLKSGTEDDNPSGSSFGGGTSRTSKKKTQEDELRDRYPALNN